MMSDGTRRDTDADADATPTPRFDDSTIRRFDSKAPTERDAWPVAPIASRSLRAAASRVPRRPPRFMTRRLSVRPSHHPATSVRHPVCVRTVYYIVYIYIGVYVFMYMSYVRVNKQNTRRPRAISRARSRASSSTFHPSNDPVDAFIRRRHQQRRSATHERANRTLYTRTVLNVGHHRSRRARTPRAHERGTTRRVRVHAAVDGGARVRGQATHRGACGRGDVEETRGRMS